MSLTPEDVDQWLQDQHCILWMDWLVNSPSSRKQAVDWVMKFLKQMKELEIKNEQRRNTDESSGGVLRTTGEPAASRAKPEAFNSTSEPAISRAHREQH